MSYRFYFDVETTGVHAGRDRIVEVACVAASEDWLEVDRFESFVHVDPEYREAEGLRVNKIEWTLLETAPSEMVVASRLRDFVGTLGGFGLDSSWHSFNVPFDQKFLEREPWLIYGLWSECVMQASHRAMAARKWPKLSEAASHFGVAQPEAHRALVDARVAMLVHEKIMRARKVINA